MAAICRRSVYLIIDIREKLCQRNNRGNDSKNEHEYRWENNKQFLYLLGIPVKWKIC